MNEKRFWCVHIPWPSRMVYFYSGLLKSTRRFDYISTFYGDYKTRKNNFLVHYYLLIWCYNYKLIFCKDRTIIAPCRVIKIYHVRTYMPKSTRLWLLKLQWHNDVLKKSIYSLICPYKPQLVHQYIFLVLVGQLHQVSTH